MTNVLTGGLARSRAGLLGAAAALAALALAAPAVAAEQTVPASIVAQLASDDQPGDEDVLRVGSAEVGGTLHRVLLKFELPADGVDASERTVLVVNFPSCYMGSGPELRAFPVSSAWDVTWAGQPEVSGEGIVADDPGCPRRTASFDVTDLVRGWALEQTLDGVPTGDEESGDEPSDDPTVEPMRNFGIELRGDELRLEPGMFYDTGTDSTTSRLDRAIMLGLDEDGNYAGPRLIIGLPEDPTVPLPQPTPFPDTSDDELDFGQIDSALTEAGPDFFYEWNGYSYDLRRQTSGVDLWFALPSWKRMGGILCAGKVNKHAEAVFCVAKFKPAKTDGDPKNKLRLYWGRSWAKPYRGHKLELIHLGFIGRQYMENVAFAPETATRTDENCESVDVGVSVPSRYVDLSFSKQFSLCGHHDWFGTTNSGARKRWEFAYEWKGKKEGDKGQDVSVYGGVVYQLPEKSVARVVWKPRAFTDGAGCSRLPFYC